MKAIAVGSGFAPDVTIYNGNVYVAYGALDGAWLVKYTLAGAEVSRTKLPDGFYNSFPRFGQNTQWCGYKTITGFVPAVLNLNTNTVVKFGLAADGNWPLFVDKYNLYWQTTNAFKISVGSCLDGHVTSITGQHGAPDGLERLTNGLIVTRPQIRLEKPSVGGYPSYAGDLIVGQYVFGIGVEFTGYPVRWIAGDSSDDHPDPRCATDGHMYAIVSWGLQGVRLWLGTRNEFLLDFPWTPGVPPPDTDIPPQFPVMLEPEITVDAFAFKPSNKLADGNYITFHDRMNSNGAQVVVWVENGSMYMQLRYGSGPYGRTGLPRMVR